MIKFFSDLNTNENFLVKDVKDVKYIKGLKDNVVTIRKKLMPIEIEDDYTYVAFYDKERNRFFFRNGNNFWEVFPDTKTVKYIAQIESSMFPIKKYEEKKPEVESNIIGKFPLDCIVVILSFLNDKRIFFNLYYSSSYSMNFFEKELPKDYLLKYQFEFKINRVTDFDKTFTGLFQKGYYKKSLRDTLDSMVPEQSIIQVSPPFVVNLNINNCNIYSVDALNRIKSVLNNLISVEFRGNTTVPPEFFKYTPNLKIVIIKTIKIGKSHFKFIGEYCKNIKELHIMLPGVGRGFNFGGGKNQDTIDIDDIDLYGLKTLEILNIYGDNYLTGQFLPYMKKLKTLGLYPIPIDNDYKIDYLDQAPELVNLELKDITIDKIINLPKLKVLKLNKVRLYGNAGIISQSLEKMILKDMSVIGIKFGSYDSLKTLEISECNDYDMFNHILSSKSIESFTITLVREDLSMFNFSNMQMPNLKSFQIYGISYWLTEFKGSEFRIGVIKNLLSSLVKNCKKLKMFNTDCKEAIEMLKKKNY